MTPSPSTSLSAYFSLCAAAAEHPERIAIVTRTESLTFRQLAERTAPIVRHFTRGSGPVAVVAALRLETLLVVYALVEIGRPIVLVHPRLTAHERATAYSDGGAVEVIDEGWSLETNPADDIAMPTLRPIGDDEDALAIIFTSGSSGAPKGVELSRRAFHAAAVASAQNLEWKRDDRWLLCMPLAHVGGLSVVLRCLAARTTVVVSPWTGTISSLLDDVSHHRVTLLSLVPTMLSRVLAEGPPRPFPAHVRSVLLGGDAASAALLAEAIARSVPVLTTYGMTETCSQVATLAHGERASPESGVGRPLPGTEVRVVDDEIQVRSKTLFTRYLPADRWPSPFLEDGWFPTKDLGHLDENGRLHVTGRRSDMIITGGENVDPREVEDALLRCPGVTAACVFGVPDERWGQIVGAALVLHGAGATVMHDLRAFVEKELAAHKRPRVVALGGDIVLNASGKVDRRATAAKVASSLVPLTR